MLSIDSSSTLLGFIGAKNQHINVFNASLCSPILTYSIVLACTLNTTLGAFLLEGHFYFLPLLLNESALQGEHNIAVRAQRLAMFVAHH